MGKTKMKQTLILTQFVILMILFVGIMSTTVSLENNLSAEKGKKKVAKANPTVVAIAFIGCKGKAKCMAAKIKVQKCKLAKFSLKGATLAVKAFAKASGAFKKAMKPVATCNITPKKMAAAFKRGLK